MLKASLIFALEKEAAEVTRKLGLELTPSSSVPSLTAISRKFPMKFYRGVVEGCLEVSVTLFGKDRRYGVDLIGTEAAAIAAMATVEGFSPDVLINAGTAGSFGSKGAKIGKVYLSDKAFYYHDHRIPISGWREFGKGNYPSLDVRALASRLNLDVADVSSGNSLDFVTEDLRNIDSSGAVLKEMEAAAIAWIAYVTETPMFAIKSVTNLIDENPDSPSEFTKNFEAAVANLSEATLAVIRSLARDGLPQLKNFPGASTR